MLVPRRKEWTVPGAINGQVDRATALAGSIADNDKTIAELKDSESHANVFGRIGAWRHDREIARARVAEGTELRSLLIQIAKSSPPSTIPEAEAGIRAATDVEEQAATLDQQIETTRRSVTGLDDELTRRGDSLRSMGFDALYEAAVLQTSGPTAVDSPLLLKAGEVAYLSVPAALSRMVTRTRYVGGSSGFSFPIGHTGIRYRVGTYRGHPVQRQALTNLDTGTLVVSTQRVAFIGKNPPRRGVQRRGRGVPGEAREPRLLHDVAATARGLLVELGLGPDPAPPELMVAVTMLDGPLRQMYWLVETQPATRRSA